MPHARTQIVSAVVGALTGLAAGGVHPSRVYPVDVLPALAVYAPQDLVESRLGPPLQTQDRTLTVTVEARVKAVSGFEAALDDLCAAVEAAIATDPTLGGLIEIIQLAGTAIEFSGEADQPTGLATLEFTAYYRVAADDPTTIID